MQLLRVFIASKMDEFKDVRDGVRRALANMYIEAFVYEGDGASQVSVRERSLGTVADCDVLVAFFGSGYGSITVEEFRTARQLRRPVLVYVRDDPNRPRDPELQAFLNASVFDPESGVSSQRAGSITELEQQVGKDIMRLLVKVYRLGTRTMPVMALADADRLAWDTADWYRVLDRHMPTTDPEFVDRDTRDFRLRIEQRVAGFGVMAQDILVACVSRFVDRPIVDSFLERFRQAGAHRGQIISNLGVSPAAREVLEKEEVVTALTLDDLIDETTNFDSYLAYIETEAMKRKLDDYYVPLACRVEEPARDPKAPAHFSTYRSDQGGIDYYFDIWLSDRRKEHLSVLGQFGSGKTWFLLRTAARTARSYRENKDSGRARGRLPLLIPLRDFAKVVTMESLFSEFFFRQYDVGLRSYDAFLQLNRMGRLLLLFDGFDEMAERVDRQKIVDNFREFSRVLVPGAKAVLTCRTEHFPDARQTWESLAQDAKGGGSGVGPSPHFERAYLLPFTEAQLREVLARRGASSDTAKSILEHRELRDIALRPQLVEFVMEALDEIRAGAEVDLARIYLYAIRRKLEREIEEGRTFLSFADKLYFMCELSWEMLSENRMSIHYSEFPDRLRRLFGTEVAAPKDLDHWQYAMQRNTMLVRNDDGEYSPAHRSLAEFFVAYKLVAELGSVASDFLALAQACHIDADPSDEPTEQTWSQYFGLRTTRKGKRLSAFAPEPADGLAERGAVVDPNDLPPATLAFAADMVSIDEIQLARLCKMAWEETGRRSQNVLVLLPHLKYRCAERLAEMLVEGTIGGASPSGGLSTQPFQPGVGWVLGELGIASDSVERVLRQTARMIADGADGSPLAWWESAFALEKLGLLGEWKSQRGTRAVDFLLEHLPRDWTAEGAADRLVRNLRAKERESARMLQFDLVAIAGCSQASVVEEFLHEALPLVDWAGDLIGRRCYNMAWLCGHLRRRNSVDKLVEATGNQYSPVRNCASEALGKIGVISTEVIAALERGLQDTYYRTRFHAAWSLGELCATEGLSPLRNAALCERVPDVRDEMLRVEELLERKLAATNTSP